MKKTPTSKSTHPLIEALNNKIIGQNHVAELIAPYVHVFQSGLSPDGRPAGVFVLLGPTGVGKTRFVEALAEVLHGNKKNVLRIDCGEFQMDHEIAKLIGSPPGYLGHRETHPLLSQSKIDNVSSTNCDLSLVLFDEIEKASPAFARLLLGVLDKATLRLGDNNTTDFSRTMIFMTSNVGAKEIVDARQRFGLAKATPSTGHDTSNISKLAMSRLFAPEFMNRLDEQITFHALTTEDLFRILDLELMEVRSLITRKLGSSGFFINPDRKCKEFLIEKGFDARYGARELKRVIHRYMLQPLALLRAAAKIEAGSIVNITAGSEDLKFSVKKAALIAA